MSGLPERTLDAVTKGPENITATAGATFFDGPEAVDLFRLVALKSALSLEIRTGMKMSRGVSTLAVANEALGTTYRRKQDALDHLTGVLDSLKETP